MEQQTADIPATIPVTAAELSFAEQRALTKAGTSEVANPAAAKLAVESVGESVAPEAEADSAKPDASISDAARTLRKNRAGERRQAIQREINDLTATKHREREELDAIRREKQALSTPRAAAPASTSPSAALDASDPEPTFDSFRAANPDHPDPYAGWQRAAAAWDRRNDDRQRFAESRRTAETKQAEQAVATFKAEAAKVQAEHSDYDVAFETLMKAVEGNPRERDITIALAESPLGARVGYHLAKHPEDRSALLTAPTKAALLKTFGRIEAAITAPVKAAPKPSEAPAPHQPVAAGSTVSPVDESDMPFGQFRKLQVAKRRAAG